MFPLQENQYSFILLTRECGLGLQRVLVLHCSDLWQLTLKNLASGWNQSQLVLYPAFLYGTWRKEVEERNHGGSTLNKKLINLFTVKGQWHLCDWSHSDQGLVLKNLVRCWACVCCVPQADIMTAVGKLADGPCAFASATTMLVQYC